MKRRTFVGAMGAMAVAGGLQAQERATSIIVPYAPGGSLDSAARLLADQLEKIMGRTFIVENKPGANGLIGTKAVQNAAPDGRTLLFNGPNIVALPSFMKEANYDPFKNFVPIAGFGAVEYFLVAHESAGAKSVADLIRYGRSRPEGIFAGNAGNGSISHMLAAAFGKHAGVKVTHVPYKGAADMMRALAAGEIQMQISTTTATLEKMQQTGRVQYLAVASAKRSTFAPGVPTLRESLPEMIALDSWSALFAPAGVPERTAQALGAAVQQAMAAQGVAERLSVQYISPVYLDSSMLKAEMAKAATAQARLRNESGIGS